MLAEIDALEADVLPFSVNCIYADLIPTNHSCCNRVGVGKGDRMASPPFGTASDDC
jgi:hypothetical protein